MKILMVAVKAFRSQLSALNVPKSVNPNISIKCKNEEVKAMFISQTATLQSLLKCGEVQVLTLAEADPTGSLRNHVTDELSTYVKVAGLINVKLEVDRLKKRQTELTKFIDGQKKKMNIPNYEQKVPESVRNDNTEKLRVYETEYAANEASIGELSQFA